MTNRRERWHQLTSTLWHTQSRWLAYNTGVIISAGEACLIDPGMDTHEMKAIADFVRAQGATPTVIFLTHWHWDHVLGPEYFPGVRVVAHPRYLNEVRDGAEGMAKEIARWEVGAGIARQRAFVPPAPDDLLDDGAELAVGEARLRLVHVPGHSSDQLAVYEPDSGALWASDILSDIEIPFVSDSLAAYERTLAKVAALDVRALVPGHGAATDDPEGIRARVARDRAYLAALRDQVTLALAAGRPVAEAVEACADIPIHHPEANAEPHQWNVESVYIELGGQADPRRVGWGQEFGE